MRTRRHMVLSIVVVSLLSQASAFPASTPGTSVADVWAREESYWRFVQAGDVDGYLTLWHEHFVGWPCGAAHPANKAAIGKWVREIRDNKIRLTYDLTREGAQDFGNTVVVYYRTPMKKEYPDGRIEQGGETFKLTHTWQKVGNDWVIVGGMCGALSQDAR